MIEINENGEVIINGENVTQISSNSRSNTISRTVVIRNGEVVQNDFSNGEEAFDMEDFHNDFIDQMGPAFQHLKKSNKIKCNYCGSIYKSSKNECPNCGATNTDLL